MPCPELPRCAVDAVPGGAQVRELAVGRPARRCHSPFPHQPPATAHFLSTTRCRSMSRCPTATNGNLRIVGQRVSVQV